ncbi:MAG: CocE/NonD family hydrolase [Gemmatimonadetes bacterium]|nr:CocE/NonD family hydrolase [Gemmatimonadota bacterium]
MTLPVTLSAARSGARWVPFLLVAAFAGATVARGQAPSGGAGLKSAPGPYGVKVIKDELVRMRDGVRLATDIYLPTRNDNVLPGRHPTVMTRSPYNKEARGTEQLGRFYASHGYAFVAQDVRGRFKSEGTWIRFVNDPEDGYDTDQWLRRQPWSNGKFAMTGCSYVGGTQHVMGLTQPAVEGFATSIPEDATSNMGIAEMRNFGAFELRIVNWIFTNGPASARVQHPELAPVLDEMTAKRREYMKLLPIRKGTTPLKLIPEYEDWIIQAMQAGRANDPFWRMNRIREEYGPHSDADKYKDVPLYLVGGWYDSKPGHTTGNYMAISKRVKGPIYLIIGPWIHCQHQQDRHGQVSFGNEAAIDQLAYNLEWYDHWLMGKDNRIGKEDPFKTTVRLFVPGTGDESKDADGLKNHGGYWRNENEWPLARTRYTNYYLQADGSLSTSAPAAANSHTTYDFDPRDPVPTIGGNISSAEGIMLQGAWDQKCGSHIWNCQDPIPLSHRNDVLVFQTEPLAEDVEVTGELKVKLWATSSALDTDFTAKLIDVHPPYPDFPGGFDQIITDGIIRARFRDSLFEEKLMEPGKIYEFTLTLYPTSNVFKKGHQIRVDVSSSNYPRFDVNPNTGEPLAQHRRMVVATNTIYHDQEHPSHIVLPIIPAASGGARR